MFGNKFLIFLALIFLAGAAGLGYWKTAPAEVDSRRADFGNWEQIPIPVDYSQSSDRFVTEFGSLNLFGQPRLPERVEEIGEDVERIPQFRLIGLARLDGRSVILLDDGVGLPQKLGEGQQTNQGWNVTAIDTNSATLRKEDQQVTLLLFPDRTGQ